jgi:hypothetical protein
MMTKYTVEVKNETSQGRAMHQLIVKPLQTLKSKEKRVKNYSVVTGSRQQPGYLDQDKIFNCTNGDSLHSMSQIQLDDLDKTLIRKNSGNKTTD